MNEDNEMKKMKEEESVCFWLGVREEIEEGKEGGKQVLKEREIEKARGNIPCNPVRNLHRSRLAIKKKRRDSLGPRCTLSL